MEDHTGRVTDTTHSYVPPPAEAYWLLILLLESSPCDWTASLSLSCGKRHTAVT